MECVEINAGTYYLRQLRADDRLDDRPELIAAFDEPAMRRYLPQYPMTTLEEAGDYVAERADQWSKNERCTWAIAELTTGRLLGEVGLKNLLLDAQQGEVAIWVRAGARRSGAGSTALTAAVRFGMGALGLTQIDYVCDESNTASAALARRCGFSLIGPIDSLDGTPSLLWTYPPAAGD